MRANKRFGIIVCFRCHAVTICIGFLLVCEKYVGKRSKLTTKNVSIIIVHVTKAQLNNTDFLTLHNKWRSRSGSTINVVITDVVKRRRVLVFALPVLRNRLFGAKTLKSQHGVDNNNYYHRFVGQTVTYNYYNIICFTNGFDVLNHNYTQIEHRIRRADK